MNRIRLLLLAVGVAIAGALFSPGKSIAIESQLPLFEALRTTASIVLGIIGVWLAIIYPHALEKIVAGSGKLNDEAESKRLWKLLRPLAYTSAILGIVLVYGVARPVIEQTPSLSKYRDLLRGISFSLLAYLTLLQLWTLVLMLVPTEALKDEINGILRRRQITERALSRAQRETAQKR